MPTTLLILPPGFSDLSTVLQCGKAASRVQIEMIQLLSHCTLCSTGHRLQCMALLQGPPSPTICARMMGKLASQPTNLQYTLKSCPYSSLGAAEAAEAAAAASLHHLVIKSFINLRLFLGKVFAKNARGNSVVVSNNSSSPISLFLEGCLLKFIYSEKATKKFAKSSPYF